MAMNASALKGELKTAIRGAMAGQGFNIDHPDTNGEADKYIDALATGIATAVVSHIQNNAVAVDTGTDPAPAGNWPIT